MTFLREKLQVSPIHARVVPYAILVILTVVQDDFFNGPGRYWMYLVKIVVALWCVREMRPLVPEMRWSVSWEAIVVGVLVFIFWVGLDPFYSKMMDNEHPWNPFKEFGAGSALGWLFVGVRTLGSAVAVPPIEEAFYRSFLYRYFVRLNFTEMPLNRRHWLSLVVTSALFGLVHREWLAGFFCGLAYQWLVLRKNRLGDALTAHAITNLLLGLWVVGNRAWQFW